jgi:Glycosyl transferases group 1
MRIGFVLLSSPRQPIPSTRIAVLNMLPLLRERGHECLVLHAPMVANEAPELPPGLDEAVGQLGLDLLVFQKARGPSVQALARRVRAMGVATCYMFCDEIADEMVRATDGSIVTTQHLRSLHPADVRHKMHVVHDGIERPQVERDHAPRDARDRLDAVLVTSSQLWHVPVIESPPPWLRLTIVGRYAPTRWQRAREAGWAARRAGLSGWQRVVGHALHPQVRLVPWSEDAVYQELRQADIGVIPVERGPLPAASAVADWALKSENRLTLKMAVGLPVVACPVPSYLALARHGENCLIANSPSEWRRALSLLRNPMLRERMGRLARASVIGRFSMQAQAERLDEAFRRIVGGAAKAAYSTMRVPPSTISV